MVAAKDRRQAVWSFTMHGGPVVFITASPFLAMSASVRLWQGRLRSPAGSAAGFYLDDQAALRRAAPPGGLLATISPRCWRFEVWGLGGRAFSKRDRGPWNALPPEVQQSPVCLPSGHSEDPSVYSGMFLSGRLAEAPLGSPHPRAEPWSQRPHRCILATSHRGANAGEELFYKRAHQPEESDFYLFRMTMINISYKW